MPATTPLTLSTHWLSNWRLSRCLSHELPKVERGTPVLGGSGDQPPPGPLITVTSTGLSSLPGPTLSECCHSGLAGCGIPLCDAADNGAIGEHVVVVIVPFARWAGSRCAFQKQVVFVHSRAAFGRCPSCPPFSKPIFLGFSLHGRRIGVLHFEPVGRACRPPRR